jgi:hypothetical protein
MVAHAYNTSYLRARDGEDQGLRPGRANSYQDFISSYKLHRVTSTCHPSYMESVNRRIVVQASLGIKVRPYSKNNKAKKAGSVAKVVECLPSKLKALSSNSSTE